MTESLNTTGLTVMMIFFSLLIGWERCYPLCVQRPPVQLSVARATPSHSRPPCLGSGAVHSLLRCLSQSELHTDHSLHSPQLPSTEGVRHKYKCLRMQRCTCSDLMGVHCHPFIPFGLHAHVWRRIQAKYKRMKKIQKEKIPRWKEPFLKKTDMTKVSYKRFKHQAFVDSFNSSLGLYEKTLSR